MDEDNKMDRSDALKVMATAAGAVALSGFGAFAAENTAHANQVRKPMYAIAINGSPRTGGNTERMLTQALEPLRQAGWETEMVQIGGRAIHGCRACFACYNLKDNTCVQNDIFNEIFQKLLIADAIIIGSPTYVSGVSSETKALIDRTVLVAEGNGDSLRGKVGAAVAVNRRSGAVNVFDSINHMFFCSQMIVPGSFSWNLGVGRDMGDVDNDAEGKALMTHLGQVIELVATTMAPHIGKWPAKPSF
jgi:multimeric flavodoxin WrbA